MTHSATRLLARASLVLAGALPLAGCGALVLGGTAATTAVVATDRRSAGEQLDDKTIGLRVDNEMGAAFGDTGRVVSTVYAGRVLLVGDVPTEQDKARATQIASAVPKVRAVDNKVRVGEVTPLSVRTNDAWLTSKVMSQMVATKDVPTRTMKVTTERGVVYLMGKVTDDEARRAAIVASGVSGVNKVVKLFDIVSAASVQAGAGQPSTGTKNEHPSATEPSPSVDDTGAQTMPVK